MSPLPVPFVPVINNAVAFFLNGCCIISLIKVRNQPYFLMSALQITLNKKSKYGFIIF